MELQTAVAVTVLSEGVISAHTTILKRFGYSTRPFESYAAMRRPGRADEHRIDAAANIGRRLGGRCFDVVDLETASTTTPTVRWDSRKHSRGLPLTRLRSEIFPLGGGGAGGARGGAGDCYRPLLARQRPSRRAAIRGRSRSRPCDHARGFLGAALAHPIAGNELRQVRGLFGQRLRRRRGLFHQRR